MIFHQTSLNLRFKVLIASQIDNNPALLSSIAELDKMVTLNGYKDGSVPKKVNHKARKHIQKLPNEIFQTIILPSVPLSSVTAVQSL